MAFPFIPGGALLALAVLGFALVLFGAAMKALDWTIDTARGSMLNGVVSGMRSWERRAARLAATTASPAASPITTAEPNAITEEVARTQALVERVTPSKPVHRSR